MQHYLLLLLLLLFLFIYIDCIHFLPQSRWWSVLCHKWSTLLRIRYEYLYRCEAPDDSSANEFCVKVLEDEFDATSPDDYQLGKTLLFLKEGFHQHLEQQRLDVNYINTYYYIYYFWLYYYISVRVYWYYYSIIILLLLLLPGGAAMECWLYMYSSARWYWKLSESLRARSRSHCFSDAIKGSEKRRWRSRRSGDHIFTGRYSHHCHHHLYRHYYHYCRYYHYRHYCHYRRYYHYRRYHHHYHNLCSKSLFKLIIFRQAYLKFRRNICQLQANLKCKWQRRFYLQHKRQLLAERDERWIKADARRVGSVNHYCKQLS